MDGVISICPKGLDRSKQDNGHGTTGCNFRCMPETLLVEGTEQLRELDLQPIQESACMLRPGGNCTFSSIIGLHVECQTCRSDEGTS
jgi:hypothetical protein